MSLIDNVGLPIRESLPMMVDILKRHRLRDRIRIVASEKMSEEAMLDYIVESERRQQLSRIHLTHQPAALFVSVISIQNV